MKLKVVSIALTAFALFISPFTSNPAMAVGEKCQTFDFKQLFIADYSTGSKWDNSSGDLRITWSATSTVIYDEEIVRPFTDKEISWIRTAFKSWDNALDTVSFREVDASESPQVTIGFVALKPSQVQLNAMGFWNAWVENGSRYRATIKLKASETKWFSNKSQFIHSTQHELGNTLGLGDLTPTTSFNSVLEDPWQPPYGKFNLSSTDVAMVHQLYGESTCAPSLATKL